MKKKNKDSKFLAKLDKNPGKWRNKLLIATPSTGLVRMEWVLARYGQIHPTNWSETKVIQWMNTYVPVEYLLPDAENLIVKTAVEGDFEWLLMIEEDNIMPPDAFIRIDEYIREAKVPIVSGLYFTKSNPPEPIIYRGRGTGSYQNFKIGDKVWVDGVPLGFILIHTSILKALWDESPEYNVAGQITRRVFSAPDRTFMDPNGVFASYTGTTDLALCTRIMEDKIFIKAGWPEYQAKKFPYLVDTNIFLYHIDQQGRQFPLGGIPIKYKKNENNKKDNEVSKEGKDKK